MDINFDRIVSVTSAAGLIVVVALLLRKELRDPGERSATSAPVPVQTTDWSSIRQDSRILLDSVPATGAKVVVVEFSDLQCPACRMYHEQVVPQLRSEFKDSVEFRFAHFPLPSHAQAMSAAIASECAAAQTKFTQFVDAAFARQGDFSTQPWKSIAADAGVADTSAFDECLRQRDSTSVIASRDRARALRLRATPSLVINGWVNLSPPSLPELRRTLRAVLDTTGASRR